LRRQLTAYIGDDDFDRLKEEADEAGLSLSRYIKERLVRPNGSTAVSLSEAKLAASEKRIIEANRAHMTQALRSLNKRITMLLAMLDQFALSMLTHLPEIPGAQHEQALASGERRHRGWRLEVEDSLRQMEPRNAHSRRPAVDSDEPQNGDHYQERSSDAQHDGDDA
jgi:hypothetical protein